MLASLLVVERLEAAICADVDLDVVPIALLVHELEGVAGVTVHLVVTIGRSTVGEQDHNLVNRLGVLREVVLQIMTMVSERLAWIAVARARCREMP